MGVRGLLPQTSDQWDFEIPSQQQQSSRNSQHTGSSMLNIGPKTRMHSRTLTLKCTGNRRYCTGNLYARAVRLVPAAVARENQKRSFFFVLCSQCSSINPTKCRTRQHWTMDENGLFAAVATLSLLCCCSSRYRLLLCTVLLTTTRPTTNTTEYTSTKSPYLVCLATTIFNNIIVWTRNNKEKRL